LKITLAEVIQRAADRYEPPNTGDAVLFITMKLGKVELDIPADTFDIPEGQAIGD